MAAASHELSVLSAGLLIYDILSADEGLRAAGCSKVFPVVSEEGAQLPYVCYRRAALQNTAVKGGRGPDAATVEVACYASSYAGSIALAEAVTAVLDGLQAVYSDDGGGSLAARNIRLADAEETWANEAYIQTLTFIIGI